MNNVNYFNDFLESIPDYRNIVLIMFLLKKDVDFLHESGFLKNDINCLCLDSKIIFVEQNGEYHLYMKNQKESFIDWI